MRDQLLDHAGLTTTSEAEACDFYLHHTAEIEPGVIIGAGTHIWRHCHIRSGALIGAATNIGNSTFIDTHVHVGNMVKIQNNVFLCRGVRIDNGCFLGPYVTFTNDRIPRAVRPDGKQTGADDWTILETHVAYGASVGAGSTILPGAHLGKWSMIAAGSVVTKPVRDYEIVAGATARSLGIVAPTGERIAHEYLPGRYFYSFNDEIHEIEIS